MKKPTTILFFLISVLLFPFFTFANTDDGVWSYVFHLEYRGGVLMVAQGVKNSYSPVPMQYTSTIDANTAESYGVITNVVGKVDAKFGVPSATSVVLATGASPVEVYAPYFADADHVAFYTKAGKHLFDISLKGSSFCNDDRRCDTAVGENFQNCPADCSAPIGIQSPEPAPTPVATTPHEVASTTLSPVMAPTQPPTQATTGAYVVKNKGNTPAKFQFDTKAILSLIGGILLIILALVFNRVRKNME